MATTHNMYRLAVKHHYENPKGATIAAYCYTKHMPNGIEYGLITKHVDKLAFERFVLLNGVCNFELWYEHYQDTFVINNMLADYINHTENRVTDYKHTPRPAGSNQVFYFAGLDIPMTLVHLH